MSHLSSLTTLASAAAGGGAPKQVSFTENLEFLLVGFVIVMVTLSALWLLCEAVGVFFKWQAARAEARARAASPATAAAAPARADSPVAIPVPVIAAAVAALVDQPHRVVEIKPASIAWSMEGRRQLLSSHKLPR
ncbi:MAG TPA: hypothetical protein DFS52_00505 [Myxococcales bacterium]|jgi:Na+-transporting methylmalonyl-CoA/oxaloacetate decarboxylase gamma subunit|nr:hypothetical protein [Myxococcales bacterium]